MGTYEAEQLLPGISLDYFLSAKQQLKVVLQWVGVKARGQAAYRIPESAGDLARDPASDANLVDFSVSQVSLQARYRWELAPLSDLFVVYTRQSNQAALLMDQDFGDVFQNSYRSPLTDAFVVKLRYRFGS